jgi:ABC-2 type transport system ATP-binding protein
VSALTDSLQALHHAGIAVEDITIRQPTLDEAFLRLTSHPSEPRPAATGQETPS